MDPPSEGGIVVLDLSSYQTELARTLAPDVAVFTNLSPDHLDRHAGPGGYFAAKRRLFAVGAPETAVIGVDEPEGPLRQPGFLQFPIWVLYRVVEIDTVRVRRVSQLFATWFKNINKTFYKAMFSWKYLCTAVY